VGLVLTKSDERTSSQTEGRDWRERRELRERKCANPYVGLLRIQATGATRRSKGWEGGPASDGMGKTSKNSNQEDVCGISVRHDTDEPRVR